MTNENTIYLTPPSYGLNTDTSRPHNIIVSMTTYPERMYYAHLILYRILEQTVKPDRILIWLYEGQYPGSELPAWADMYKEAGAEFRFSEDNLRSHLKYYYTILENPDSVVILVDDDVLYERTLIERLYNSYLKFPLAVSSSFSRRITFDKNNNICRSITWIDVCDEYVGKPSMRLYPLSGQGTLIPPNALHDEAFNKEAIFGLCYRDDDIWLKTMSVLAGTPVVLTMPNVLLPIYEGAQSAEGTITTADGWSLRENTRKKVFAHYNEFHSKDDTLVNRIRTMYPNEADKTNDLPFSYGSAGIKKKAVYTAVTGGELPFEPDYVNNEWDYICFTDNPNANSGLWRMRELPRDESLTPELKVLAVKILPHIYLPDYDFSLWTDSKLLIHNDIDEIISNNHKGSSLLCFSTGAFSPDFEKYARNMLASLKNKSPSYGITAQIAKYEKDVCFRNKLVYFTRVLFRKHGDPGLVDVMNLWWDDILKGFPQDFLSFNCVLNKTGYQIDTHTTITNGFYKSGYFLDAAHPDNLTVSLLAATESEPVMRMKTVSLKDSLFRAGFNPAELEAIDFSRCHKLFFSIQKVPVYIQIKSIIMRVNNKKEYLSVKGANSSKANVDESAFHFTDGTPMLELTLPSGIKPGDKVSVSLIGRAYHFIHANIYKDYQTESQQVHI